MTIFLVDGAELRKDLLAGFLLAAAWKGSVHHLDNGIGSEPFGSDGSGNIRVAMRIILNDLLITFTGILANTISRAEFVIIRGRRSIDSSMRESIPRIGAESIHVLAGTIPNGNNISGMGRARNGGETHHYVSRWRTLVGLAAGAFRLTSGMVGAA